MKIREALDITIVDGTNFSEESINSRYSKEDFWTKENGKTKFNERRFAEVFIALNLLVFYNNTLYTGKGVQSEDITRRDIWTSLGELGINSSAETRVKNILSACKMQAIVDKFKVDENMIPFANGNYYVSEKTFKRNEIITLPYHLPVELVTAVPDTPYFNKWLDDLFEKDDQRTLQEYLGYCLVPTTKCQKALFLVGEGGAGKSGMGVILNSLLDRAIINVTDMKEFLDGKFMLSSLDNKLVLYVDDLDTKALERTGVFKQIVTSNIPLTVDKKNKDPVEFTPKVKVIACCNKMLMSLYDKTDGFYRRLLPLIIKPKDKGRIEDRNFYDHLSEEAPGIVVWALVGLQRLIANNWQLYESERTKSFMKVKKAIEDPMYAFMDEVFEFGKGLPGVPTSEITKHYNLWREANAAPFMTEKKISNWLGDNYSNLGLKPSKNIKGNDGKPKRGYEGLRLRHQNEDVNSSNIDPITGKLDLDKLLNS